MHTFAGVRQVVSGVVLGQGAECHLTENTPAFVVLDGTEGFVKNVHVTKQPVRIWTRVLRCLIRTSGAWSKDG